MTNDWIERDPRTGDVLLCWRTPSIGAGSGDAGGGASAGKIRHRRYSREDALLLAGRIAVACDERTEAVVESAQAAARIAADGRTILAKGAELLDAAERLLGGRKR